MSQLLNIGPSNNSVGNVGKLKLRLDCRRLLDIVVHNILPLYIGAYTMVTFTEALVGASIGVVVAAAFGIAVYVIFTAGGF